MRTLIFTLCCLFFITPAFSQDAVFVSPDGNDANSGLSDKEPVATIPKALELVKSKENKEIQLLEGIYRIEQPIVLTPEFSGLRVEGPGTISGGRTITGWKPYKDGIWQAEIPAAKDGKWSFRQIYVNGELRHRARTPNEGFYRVAGCPEGTPKTVNYHTDCQTFEFKPGDIRPDWKNMDDVEVIVYYFWVDNHLPIESIDTEKNIVKFKFKGDMTFTDDFSEDGARYVVENVFEALDSPGEWYLDKPTGILYYMPKEGEDMNKAEVIAPFATELLRIEGDPQNNKFVEEVEFSNISFEHCNFLFPPGKVNSPQGASDIAAAINMTGVRDSGFQECSFSNLGTYAIDMKAGCDGNSVVGCQFRNLSAGAIRIDGGGAGSNPLIHTKNNEILGNEIAHYGLNYHSANGIIVKNSYENYITANHIHHGYEIGISLGWVWGYGRSIARGNVVESNHIHHIGQGLLSDMGGIYTLGPSPGTVIRGNLIHDIDANKYGGWGIYNDEGSTGILVEKNIVYNTKFAGYDMHYGKEIT
ncbi:MAG: right-handed parallel beta-helix repeat-containing protein, partial [Planctomycetaceae bacterium]|nr:right-handed parallel beta-helix repeat-containing protein [Planctomycetaceae bacterium]